MTGPMVTWASGNSCFTAWASRCAVECRMTSRPSGSLSVTIARFASWSMHVGGVDELAIHAPGERGLAQAGANVARDLIHRYGVVEAALAAIGQGNNGHVRDFA